MSDLFSLEKLNLWMAEAGLQGEWRAQTAALWSATAQKSAYLPVAYTEAMIDYQYAYMQGAGWELMDLSLVLFHDRQPCGVWPLCLRKRDGVVIGSNEGAVLPPLFSKDLAAKSVKSLVTACLAFLDRLAAELGGLMYESLCPFRDEWGLSEWQTQLLRRGAKVSVRHGLWIDLTLELAQIKASFRKSYKALITSGSKQWNVGLMVEADAALWQEFRELHCAVAGRVTRSAESWQRQLEAIRDHAAFLIFLRDAAGRMVGGGFFHISRDEGLYAVAAYDRELFDLPLGHVVQYAAIQELQRRKLHWYYIGTRFYPQDLPPPTSKELHIAEFKEGFATHVFPEFKLLRMASRDESVSGTTA